MFGKNGIAGLMKQAQHMQENMKKVQEELALISHEGQAGNGLVKVSILGSNVIQRVNIDPSLLSADADDKETLEDLITLAINDGLAKVAALSSERMAGFSQGLPAGMKLPF
ncbi:MAG: YbaB/EbfC family nucleoid-associated protein [Neisseriaceae bacterium]|nr:YbaB/EbfC family nucleoid-associated protein [Neisseriaceae bacterium]